MSIDGQTITGSAVIDDRQILQAELARVNLLRIRGDISSSKTLCLSILKRFPESVDAHVMMGDLHSEQGDLAPAAEWYSLALDLDRNAPGVGVKLNRVQAALDITGQASKSRIMVANGRQISPWLYVAVAASVIAIGSIAYIAGLKSPADQTAQIKPSITDKIVSPSSATTTPIRNDFADTTPRNSQVSLPATSPGPAPSTSPTTQDIKSTGTAKESPLSVVEDQRIFDQVVSRTKFGKHIVSIVMDPREKSMILTYNVANGEHGRYIGAILADVAMEYENKVAMVTLRGVRNGALSYIADVPREKIMAVENKEGKDVQDLDSHSWIDEVLTNEFYKDQELTKSPSI